MAMTIHVDIVSAEQAIFSGTAEFVVAPGETGEIGVLPHHAPLLTRLKPGTVRIKVQNRAEEELIYVSGGLMEVQPLVLTILADTAVRGKDLDEVKAVEAKQRAEEALRNRASAMDYAMAQAELAEAVAQLQAIQRVRKHRAG
jgi:F-type H+-transporting ATPase subunit epsilon